MTYHYIGTVTFDPSRDYKRKVKLIERFPLFVSDTLKHTGNTEYVLKYTIEYHKVGQEDDPEAPHIHFILSASNRLPKYRFTGMLNGLRQYYGRSQLFLATTMKLAEWSKYIMKDVERNEQKFGLRHCYEVTLYSVERDDDALEDIYWNEDF